jgi:hypothetical protein
MRYDEAFKIMQAGNEMRHPGMARGCVIRMKNGGLVAENPIAQRHEVYTPTTEDLRRTDWTAGQGLAAL